MNPVRHPLPLTQNLDVMAQGLGAWKVCWDDAVIGKRLQRVWHYAILGKGYGVELHERSVSTYICELREYT
jgi:hypothetical protein